MDFKSYKQEIQQNLPPNLEAGTILSKVVRIQENTFMLSGKETKGMRVFVDENGQQKEYRTSSGVVMEQLTNYFKSHPNEPLTNVKVVSPRGKNYLTLEEV